MNDDGNITWCDVSFTPEFQKPSIASASVRVQTRIFTIMSANFHINESMAIGLKSFGEEGFGSAIARLFLD